MIQKDYFDEKVMKVIIDVGFDRENQTNAFWYRRDAFLSLQRKYRAK